MLARGRLGGSKPPHRPPPTGGFFVARNAFFLQGPTILLWPMPGQAA